MDVETRQPTMRRANTSITKATSTVPDQAGTSVKSLTQSWLGRSALNRRLTLSSGQGRAASGLVVTIRRPRTTPLIPMAFISRSTVQRATSRPSRRRACQILRAP